MSPRRGRWRTTKRVNVRDPWRVAMTLLALFALLSGYLTTRVGDADRGTGAGRDAEATTAPIRTGSGSALLDVGVGATPGPLAATPTGAVTGPIVDGDGVGDDEARPVGAAAASGTVPSASVAASSSRIATVVGTEKLEIRSCSEPACRVFATAPLGASVMLAAQGNGGEPAATEASDYPATGVVVPVAYEGKSGFASDLFLTTNRAHVPYLLQGGEGCKRVALIFNVGVGEEPVTGILDTLKAERVPATMFVMGWWAAEHPPILQRMVDEGYPIGSHGYDSVELTTRPYDEVADDVERATTAIEHATGKPVARYFTPYAAAIDERGRAAVAAAGYLPVSWTVSAVDYGADATEDSVYANVIANVHDGALVELHLDAPASAEATGRALPRLIDDLRAQGYRFVTVPEMAQPCPSFGAESTPWNDGRSAR